MEQQPQQKKPSALRAIEAITLATLLSAGFLALIVWTFISWRSAQLHSSESASSTPAPENTLEVARKSGGLIGAKVQATGVVEDQRPIDLEGTASVRRAFPELHYKWILPDDVKHLGGALGGRFDNVSAGDNFQVKLRVEGKTPGAKKLFFRVYANNGRDEIGQTAVFLTGKTVTTANEEGSQKLRAQSTDVVVEAPKAPRSVKEFRRRAIR